MLDNAAFLVYLFGTLLPNLKTTAELFCVALFIATVVHFTYSVNLWHNLVKRWGDPEQSALDTHRRGVLRIFWLLGLFLTSCTVSTLTPSSEQSYGILATIGVVELSKVEEVQEISKNAYDALNNYFLSIKPKE